MTHEGDIFPDDLPEGRGQPQPLTDLIMVDYWDTKPDVLSLARQREKLIKEGYSAVTSEVIHQLSGMAWRIEYRGVK